MKKQLNSLLRGVIGGYLLLSALPPVLHAGMSPVTTGTLNGQGVFYVNGSQLFLRGSNYIVLDSDGHCLFEPSLYSSSAVETALEQMHAQGYNYVRVFLDCKTLSTGFGMTTPGISSSYLNCVADFLTRAANNQIYVMLTADYSPSNYDSIVYASPVPADVSGENYITLDVGQAIAKAQFFTDLLTGLKSAAPNGFSSLFAIDIFNEICVSVHDLPYSQSSGTFTYNNVAYDLSNPTQRQLLVDVSGAVWLNTVSAAIKKVAPSVLVTASVFPPGDVGHNGFDGVAITPANADNRYPLRPSYLVTNSNADYADIHQYVIGDGQQDEGVVFQGDQLSQFSSWPKPIVLGEYGAFKSGYPTADHAAWALKNFLILTASYGFTGWGMWTWDTTTGQGQPIWTLTEQCNALNNVLSPKAWPTILMPYLANGTYTLAPSCAPSLCLAAVGAGTSNGTQLDIGTAIGATNQKWVFSSVLGDIYRISPAYATTLALDVTGAQNADGIPVDLWTYGGPPQQLWMPMPNGDGTYTLTPCNAEMRVLDVTGGGAVAGTGVDIFTATYNNTAQKWTITPSPGTLAITTPPLSQVITAGQPVTLSVTASGAGRLTYQWLFNGVAISGATGSSYSIPSASSNYAGSYSVVVGDANGTVTTSPVSLTVIGTDTPTMPQWALIVLVALLIFVATRQKQLVS